MKIRFAGFGGQGVVLCGLVFGRSALREGKNAIQTQSYGSASRGGLTRSDVCIQEGEIHDLVYEEIDVLAALSQQSHDRYTSELAPEGRLFYEADLVVPADGFRDRADGIRVTDIAYQQFGRKIVANMIMMGFVNGHLKLLEDDGVVRTIRESVPPGTEDLNEAAYREGVRLSAEGR